LGSTSVVHIEHDTSRASTIDVRLSGTVREAVGWAAAVPKPTRPAAKRPIGTCRPSEGDAAPPRPQ
jgi:hypothetical protein